MALDAITSLAVAELTIYILLLPLIVYVLVKHGKYGIFGWVFLFLFGVLRIVSSAMQIDTYATKSTSTTATIVNSVGVSPLILALSGVLTEANHYTVSGSKTPKRAVIIDMLIHITTITAISLAAVGASNLANNASDPAKIHTGLTLSRVGYFLLLAVVLFLLAWSAVTYDRLAKEDTRRARYARALTLSMAVAGVFVTVRVIYGLVFAFDRSPTLSPATGSFGVRFCFLFLMQLIAAGLLLAGGVVTRNIVGSGVARDSELEIHEAR